MKLSLLLGGSRYTGFSYMTSSFLASFPVFFSYFLPPFFLLSSAFRYSYKICFFVNLGAARICSSSSVSCYPLSFFNSIRNRLLVFFARSALPGSASSHDFLVCFSLSYCLVSLTSASESWADTCATQHIFSVCSFLRTASGQVRRSNSTRREYSLAVPLVLRNLKFGTVISLKPTAS